MADQRTFVGEADPGGGNRLWYHDGTGVRRPVEHVARHSPHGLSWGYAGKGPADAALSLLAAATGNEEAAEAHHQAFMGEVVAKLPVSERFALPVGHVEAWLAAKGVELGPARGRQRPVSAPDSAAQDAGEVASGGGDLLSRARALDERERRLLEREVRVDAMAAAVGLLAQVQRGVALPAEPVRRHLEALVIDTGDDVDVVAEGHGLEPPLAGAILAGTVKTLELGQVRQVCEGLRCTPYDLWGPAGARSIAHAYGPAQWPAGAEPLLPVDGTDAAALAPSADWPAVGAAAAAAAPELVPDLGPKLVL